MRPPADNTPVRRRPRRRHGTCAATGKIRYRDGREATDALHALVNRARLADENGGQHTINVRRKYRCAQCGGWHLTSWTTPDSPFGNGLSAVVGVAA